MNVVDSSGWIEYFTAGPNAEGFAPAIEDIDQLLVSTICLTEVYRWVLRKAGRDEALRAMTVMRQGTVVDLDDSLAVHAAEYGVATRLPLADSIVYAVARRYDARIWTQDVDFEGLEGVRHTREG